MGELLGQPVALDAGVLIGVALVVVVLLVVIVVLLAGRKRRMNTSVDDAVMEALQRVSQAVPDLREGLTVDSADNATPHLRELLRCVAVGITEADGTLLSWDGEAAEHYADLVPSVAKAIAHHRKEHVTHGALRCDTPGRCPMRTAVIVPLIVDGGDAGSLIVVGGVDSKRRLIRMAEEIAHFVCTELEVAKFDESKQRLARAEVQAMRAQISPHFVYNALNTISSLVRTDPERARDLLQEFAEFTRYCFRTSDVYTTLGEELRNIDRYFMLERARYGARLLVRLKIAPEVVAVPVPFLVLQPLVENAVKHGLASKPGGGTITVIAQDHGPEALISVEDDGVGMDAERLTAELADAHREGGHVGIGNVNQRMRMAYGKDYALIVETAPDEGMKITLRVPKFSPGVRPGLPDYVRRPEPPVAAHQ